VAERKKFHRYPPSDTDEDRPEDANTDPPNTVDGRQTKIEILGEEMIEKRVKASASGMGSTSPGMGRAQSENYRIIKIDRETS
jgi:hypothetical protein